MFKIFIPLLSILLTLPVTAAAKEPIRILSGMVTKVSDGDTITVNADGTKVKVRLYGIDAPETGKSNKRTGKVSKPGQPYGEEAFQALRRKVDRRRVQLEVMDIDRYQRAVSLIRADGRDVNKEMVAEGYAWAYRQYLDRPYASEFIKAEEDARRKRLGLWQDSKPVPPWEFRRALRIR